MKKRIFISLICLALCVSGCQSASNAPSTDAPDTSTSISLEQDPNASTTSEPTENREQGSTSEPTESQEQESTEPLPVGSETATETEAVVTEAPTAPSTEVAATQPEETTPPATTEAAPTVHTHSYDGGTVTQAPSCASTGVKTYTCTVCGAVKTEPMEKTAHSWQDATCTSAKTCSVCGASSGSALGHSFANGVCTRCGYQDPSASTDPYQMARDAFEIMNGFRAGVGLSPLTWSDAVYEAALVRANEITEVFDHTRPDGTACFTALDACGIGYFTAGENIAAGQRSAQQVMTSWYNSQGHRENMLYGAFTQAAIACVYIDGGYGYYWVTLFIG